MKQFGKWLHSLKHSVPPFTAMCEANRYCKLSQCSTYIKHVCT